MYIGRNASTARLLNLATTALEADEVDADELSVVNLRITDKVEILRVLNQEVVNLAPHKELHVEEEIRVHVQQADEYIEGIYRVFCKADKDSWADHRYMYCTSSCNCHKLVPYSLLHARPSIFFQHALPTCY